MARKIVIRDEHIIAVSFILIFANMFLQPVMAAASNIAMTHLYDDIGISHACSYYEITNNKFLTEISENEFKSLKVADSEKLKSKGYRNGIKEVYGKISNYGWEYLVESKEDCSYVEHVPKEVCETTANNTRACHTEYEEKRIKKTCTVSSWEKVSEAAKKMLVAPRHSVQARFCADIEREPTEDGWSIKVDHVPELDGVVYESYAWWDSDWDHRVPVEITPRESGHEYKDYMMNVSLDINSLITAGKIMMNFSDVRMTDETDTEIPIIVVNPPSGNASIWFNFTTDDPTSGETYYIYYGNSEAGNQTQYDFDDFQVGSHFDLDGINAAPPGWAFETVSQESHYSGTYFGNHSHKFTTARAVNYALKQPLVNGTIQLVFNASEYPQGNGFIFGLSDAGGTETVQLMYSNAFANHFVYEDSAGIQMIENAQINENYYINAQWDTLTDKYNMSIRNSTWSWSNNNIGFKAAGDAITKLYKVGSSNTDFYIDDLIIRNTSGIWNDPLALVGAEEVPPLSTEEDYEPAVMELTETTFLINITKAANTDTFLGGFFGWNGTNRTFDTYEEIVEGATTKWQLTETFTVPDIVRDFEIINFNWTYRYNKTDSSVVEESAGTHTQTIYQPFMSFCNATLTPSKRIVFRNETSDFGKVNATGELAFLYNGATFNVSFTNETKQFCIYPGFANLMVDGEVKYYNLTPGGYTTRYYFFEDMIFDNSSEDWELYLIDNLDADLVSMTIQDSASNVLSGIIVQIQRYYPEINSYKTVSAPKSDDQGKTNTYLNLYDVEYRFMLYDGTELQDVKNKQLITSDTLTLTVSPSGILEWIVYSSRMSSSCNYDNETFILNCTYSDTSDYLRSVTLTTVQRSAYIQSTLCENTSSQYPSGNVVCYVGNATTSNIEYTLEATLKTDMDGLYTLATGFIDSGIFVNRIITSCTGDDAELCQEAMLMTFFFVLLMAFVAAWSAQVSIIMTIAGLGLMWYSGLLMLSTGTIVSMVFLAALIIYKLAGR